MRASRARGATAPEASRGQPAPRQQQVGRSEGAADRRTSVADVWVSDSEGWGSPVPTSDMGNGAWVRETGARKVEWARGWRGAWAGGKGVEKAAQSFLTR